MSKLRSVNTKFWDDTFIVDLDPKEKLLFLYLITNPLTNLLGIYEISIRKISFDTGLTQETVQKGLERFGTVRKAFFVENYIILPNWLKNQKLNANMRKAVEREFNELPNWLKENILANDSEGLGNGYETIRNGLGMIRQIEVEVEDEIEDEVEDESKGKIKKTWRNDFEIYKEELRVVFKKLINDPEFIEQQEKFYPGVDIALSIEKACVNFWATEAGWKNKKSKKTKDIDWKTTLSKAIDKDKVYKPKNSSGFNPSDTRTQPNMKEFNGNF